MTDSFVDVRARLSEFGKLAHLVASLPAPFRPRYFSFGGRVRDKTSHLIEDEARFGDFIAQRVDQVSGFDLIGERITYGFFVGETRSASHETTHVGCSAVLRGSRWSDADLQTLLKTLCGGHGVERGEACRRAEWEFRHKCVKKFKEFSIERTLGVDMSAAIPSLYWWTVFSEELVSRHRLDIADLRKFAKSSERWTAADDRTLHAFRMYESPDDWMESARCVTEYLERHPSFFSLKRLAHEIDAAKSKSDFDEVTRPYVAGARPW